ncbi:reverse transcriptase domain-containing protein [Tanacetum coccineum]|uniref:Reverse transcriptase domain-containing protein n=1 Tax=Tanacetum coccineum TaxID=301880 RepID=A0ABQ5BIZ2_9ASTR
MADNRTMAQMLQAPIEGYEDAIVVPPINANNFELKQPLINLVQSNKFTGRQDPHNHLRFFNKVTSTFRHPEVPNTSIKLLLFPFSLDGEARDWLDKEPPRSILTWDDLVLKFINQFFPPSKTTYLRNEITTFYQKPNETFNEAWERFKGLLRQCPHHGFSELHQLDTFYNSLNTNDQDALDSVAGGNFLDKMPREGLAIIESKSKVRYSRSRPNDSRAITNAPSSTSSPSNNSFEIQQMAALLEDKMNIRMSRLEKAISEKNATTPATVKAVEEVCVTCGSNHNFNNCPLTRNDFPVFHDNIHQFQQTAAVGNFVQRNPPNLANQMRPPGFNQPNVQNNQGNQSRYQGNNFNSNQNRGGNFNHQNNQGQVFQPPTNQPPVYQVPPYQAPTPQIQGVSKTDFENYVKANDAVLKNVQNQGQNLQNQMANVTSLLTSLCNNFKNSASTSNSGTLPSQTVTNPRQQINAITTRSGKTLEEPSTPLVPTPVISIPQKEPEQNPETSTEKVQNPNLENTAHVPPPEEEDSIFIEIPKPKAKKTINVEIQDLNSPRPNSYPSKLPYPERMKVRENDKPSAQHSRFLKMFKQLRLEIGLKDALVEMPKFNKWLSSFLRNKEKLEEIVIMTVNAECSAIIMNKVPKKLEDPGKFLIPCALQELNRTSALADSRASINLLPYSIYKKLELEALTPTRMTLELANRSITHPMGIAEDVIVRVNGFTFLSDFVVVNFEPDPRVPIILGRPFLRTAKALIDLYEETLTLRVGKEELVYYADKSKKNKEKNFVHAISIIDFSKDDPFSGSTTNTLPPSSSPVKTSDNLEKFADELAPLDSLSPSNDDSTLKKDFHEETFQVDSNPLFEFDDNFKFSNVNPLFEENDKDAEIKSSSFFTLTSPKDSEFEAYLERDSIPPGIDLSLPPALEVSSSNPTSPTLTGEKVCSWKTSMFFSLVRFVWKMMTRIAIRKKIICLLATYLHKKPKLLSRPQEVEEIKEKENEVSSDVPIHTIVMPIRITFDNPIDFNDHFSKPKDFKKDLTVSFDSSESSILPSPLLDSDSPFTAELSASVTLNSLGNEDKVFKPGILVYHAIHDKNLVTLEENLKENISSGTLLVFKEPSFLLPPPEPPDKCLNFEPILVMKNVVLNEAFYQSNVEDVNSFTIIIWIFLPYFPYTKESPLIFSFRSENFVFDPGIVTFHKPVVRIYQKSQENHQKQASTDTRTEECTKAGSQSQKKSNLQSTPVNLGQQKLVKSKDQSTSLKHIATSSMEKHKWNVGFTLGLLREVTQCHIKGITRWQSLVTPKITDEIRDPMIEEMDGDD